MTTKRALLAEAHRARAGAIGLLTVCSCGFPTVRAPTSTFHELLCPAHAMTLSAISAGLLIPTGWTQTVGDERSDKR